MVANQMAKFNYWKEASFKVITKQVADGESRKECIVTACIPGNSKFERGLLCDINMIYPWIESNSKLNQTNSI